MRLRAIGSTKSLASVSLKTSNRRAGMDAAEQLSGFVRAFHLDNPDASWSKLKEHFRVISMELFEAGREGDVTQVWGGLCNRSIQCFIGKRSNPIAIFATRSSHSFSSRVV